MTKLKKYNIFVLLSSFAKAMIEVFIPIILFERGYGIKGVLIFLLLKFTFVGLFIPLSSIIGKKINFKNLIILSNFLFIIMNIYFNYVELKFYQVIIFTLIYSSYLIFYWMGRHIFAMSIIEEKRTTENVSSYTISSLIGTLPATYISALILRNFGFGTLCIVLLIATMLSVIPLYYINEDATEEQVNIILIIKKYPLKNYLFIFLEQIKQLVLSIFPLYVYIEISKKYEYIGITNAIICVSSIIYVYFLAKLMDKNKKDYLSLLSVLLAVSWIFKISVFSRYLILIVMFFEGIFIFGLETIILRNIYSYGKECSVLSYNLFMETLRNSFRVIILLLYIIVGVSLKTIIIIGIIALFISAFIKFDDGIYGYKKSPK